MMSENEQQPNEEPAETSTWSVIFWILWMLGLLLFPFYIFTLFFEVNVVKEGNVLSHISPLIGVAVLIAQAVVMIFSFKQMKQMKQKLPLSKPYLTLLGGSIIIGFIWAGGCAMMGPWSLH